MEKWLIYPTKVLKGEILACEYIKLACKRFLSFIDRKDMDFRPDKAEKAIRFISKFKHFTGSHNGEYFILSDYQEFIIYSIYSFYWKGTNRRVCKNVWLETARKSGKSFFTAAIGLFELIGFGEAAAEIDIAANSRQQASILYGMASTMIQQLDPKGKIFKVLRNQIKFPATHSICQSLAAEAGVLDGYNCSCAILDEVHEAKDDKMYSVLQSSMAMRLNPLIICCTTAGFNLNGFGYRMHENAVNVLQGIIEDDTQQAFIFTIDKDDSWEDESIWIKSNPNLGQTVSYDFLRDQVRQAKNNNSLRTGILTKSFNLWLSSEDCWIADEKIREIMKPLKLEDFKGHSAFIGLDLSAVSDLTALSVMIPLDGKFYFWNYIFLPEDTIEYSPNRENYKYWRDNGFLIETDGNVQDLDAILKKIIEISKIVNIENIGYDSWGITQLAIKAQETEIGYALKPVSQSIGNFSRGHKMLETIVLNKQAVIDNNPIVRWNFNNIVVKEDLNGNCKGVKQDKASNQKIDSYISMTECLLLYLDSPFNNNDLFIL